MRVYVMVGVYGGVVNTVSCHTDFRDAIKAWELFTEEKYSPEESPKDEMVDGTHIWEQDISGFENLEKKSDKTHICFMNDSSEMWRVRRANPEVNDFLLASHATSDLTVNSSKVFVKVWDNGTILITEMGYE